MSHYPVYLPAQREPRGQDEVVLELTAGAEIAAVEIVFALEPQTNRRRERNPQTEAGDAAPIRDAFAFAGHVMTTANECRATTQEDADPRRCGRQAEHQLGAAAGATPPVNSSPIGLLPQNVSRAPAMKLLSRVISEPTLLK